jgi:hypothetical protein
MNKFTKRIVKSTKNQSVCLVVGTAFGNLEELANVFDTVFLHTNNRANALKKKNIIFLETIDSNLDIPLVSMIFLDLDYLTSLSSFRQLLTKYSPTLMIGSGEFIDKAWNKFLNDHRYQIIELFKDYQIWTMKK